ITGAGGFVGKNLAEALQHKMQVLKTSRADVDLLDADAVEGFVATHKINRIIHCASEGGARKTGYDATQHDIVKMNLQMLLNLKRCLTDDMHMIYFGSGAEYDKRQPLVKVNENSRALPIDDYGFAKYAMSQCIGNAKNITCLRIFGLYGKYEDYRYKFISNAILKNMLGMPMTIHQNVCFDYLYMDDLVRIVEGFLKTPPSERIINVTPTQSIDLITITQCINEASQKQTEVVVLNEGMNLAYTGDNQLLLSQLPQFNFTTYAQGIKCLYKYYQSVVNTLDIDCIKADPFIKYCKTGEKHEK
ncbi:MAG: NAD(P)-dependent oxidoreductase, partial [Hyphomonadaceae bacterium]|nr:NAD(P)-dependent oxidoreductase [Clostridia bacterium]